jgi:thymidylate synthase
MFINISEESADAVWKKAANLLLKPDASQVQQSRLGSTTELLHVSMTLRSPRDRWVASRIPAINPAFALADLVWILNGANESSTINFWNPRLPKFAGRSNTYHGAYGFRLRCQFGMDQLLRAYEVLRKNPESRQVVLQMWDAGKDLPNSEGNPASEDIPCNLCSILKVRNKKLEWLQVIRSNDVFLGLPYNFVQFTSLQEIMAGWLGLEIGEYHQVSDSLHLYDHDRTTMKISNNSIVHNTDILALPKSEFDSIITRMYSNMQRLTDTVLTEEEIIGMSNLLELPDGYRNMMLLIGADVARRRNWHSTAGKLVNECTNALYREMWLAWDERTTQTKRKLTNL